MKKGLQKSIFAFAMIGLMFSCSTSNDVTSNRRIQKRKYNKGFFVDFNKNVGGKTEAINVDETEVVEETPVVFTEEIAPKRDLKKEVLLVEETSINTEAPVTVDNVQEEAPVTASVEKQTQIEKLSFEKSSKNDISILKSDIKPVKRSFKEKKRALNNADSSDDAILYYILAIFIPFLAVGLVTDWDITKVVICLLLSFLFWIPGIIYALIVVSKNV